jgi:hypothetical protein
MCSDSHLSVKIEKFLQIAFTPPDTAGTATTSLAGKEMHYRELWTPGAPAAYAQPSRRRLLNR